MMFSMEKCTGRSGAGTTEEAELFAGGGDGMGKGGVASDEVASAVAAVSDEIGDILKDELGDSARAERIGAELADLSAELGLLAGLADGETSQDFAGRFEVPFEWIAMGDRVSGSASSSSSWSGGRGAAPPRPARPKRHPRRRPISKGKEAGRRVTTGYGAGRRAVSARVRRTVDTDSDLAADTDSTDQWTELDDQSGSSGSSSAKEAIPMDTCDDFPSKGQVEPPAMRQLLLPLLSEDPTASEPEHFLIRQEDILQLLLSTGEVVREELDETTADVTAEHADNVEGEEEQCKEEPPITPAEEATLLKYVCEAERLTAESSDCDAKFTAIEEWLLGVYHSWCEISALMYTLVGTNMSEEMVSREWVYRASLGCHCRLCLALADNAPTLAPHLTAIVASLARGTNTMSTAAAICRALRMFPEPPDADSSAANTDNSTANADNAESSCTANFARWDIPRLRRVRFSDEGAAIIHEQLTRMAQQSEFASELVNKICLCRIYDHPFEKEYAVERFCKLLENFKAASSITFKVEMIPVDGAEGEGGSEGVAGEKTGGSGAGVALYLAPHYRPHTATRLAHMRARTTDLSAWSGYRHRCDCLTPRTLCAQQRKQLLRISFFGMMQAVNEFNGARPASGDHAGKPTKDQPALKASGELQQGDGTGAKPPDCDVIGDATARDADVNANATAHDADVTMSATGDAACNSEVVKLEQDVAMDDREGIIALTGAMADLDDISESDANSGSTNGSQSVSGSSLDSASELLLAAAAAVDSCGEDAPRDLCRTVRHLMRSIASIERLMDRVLKHCDEWPAPQNRTDHEARKRVDVGLSEVDRKLMAMYRRLPEVHRRQLQVYRKQKKLSTVCMQLVGGGSVRGAALPPPPPPPGSPPRHHAHPADTLCPEYHLQRFREVRRKVMHMRDQQLYYHRLRMWLEDQLKHEKETVPESNVTLVEDLPRRKRRTLSPKVPRLATAPKRKLKPISPSLSKPHKILQLLKKSEPKCEDLDSKPEVEPPEAFPLEKEENFSDTETIVGEKETDLCKEMKECLAKFANFDLNADSEELNMQVTEVKNPESVSPPLQEMSPTTNEPVPVYTPKPSQRLLTVNKLLNRNNLDFKDDKVIDFKTQITDINIPLNARRTPVLVKEETDKDIKMVDAEQVVCEPEKDPNIYKYVTFGLEIKKAMEECQNIINSYNSIKEDIKEDNDPTLEQICEVMMTLDKGNVDFFEKMDEEPLDNTKLAELVENMPQILANMPEIASKLSEFANASFELPEFASIMNSFPDITSEAQLTPETLKQIRELKLNKARDSVKVTKNTAKRKIPRRFKNNVDHNDVVGTMTFEVDNKDIKDLDGNEIEALMFNDDSDKDDYKNLLFSISAQVVINKVFDYAKQNSGEDNNAVALEGSDIFAMPNNSVNSDIYTKAAELFDYSVKGALDMNELRDIVKSRFIPWKHYIGSRFKNITDELIDQEIEILLDKFYSYVQDLSEKQYTNENDKIMEKIDEVLKVEESDSDSCPASKESMKQITKLLSTSAGNTFDLLIMKLSKMSHDHQQSVKSLKFKYMDVIRRCAESQQLASWILIDPEIAANVILELTGIPYKKGTLTPDFSRTNTETKTMYFLDRLKEMNRLYMKTIPKQALTGDEWLVLLYRLEESEERLKEAFEKLSAPPPKGTTAPQTQTASEAEILAAKGLSKIIQQSKANSLAKLAKKPETKPVKSEPQKPVEKEPQDNSKETEIDKKLKNDALLAKCEAILTSKGEKALLENFYTIKSYITQGIPVPESYKKHVISICSTIDAKLLDEDLEETLKGIDDKNVAEKETDSKNLSIQNPELLAKYSAQALRNAKPTLNSTFRNMIRGGQTKSESDACDTPKTDCKWTNDCICNTCKESDSNVCLGDLVKQCYDSEGKSKSGLEEKKKEAKAGKPQPAKLAKPAPKACENGNHQQHVCKVGHTANGAQSCAGEAGADQPCSCCYCTVFGHAPPLTTPVPRNFNETRERLRSILNKKKQKGKVNGEHTESAERKQASVQTQQQQPAEQPQPRPKQPVLPQPKPPALPKTLPPNLTPQAQQKRQAIELQQKQLAEKMAKMVVSERPEIKHKPIQRPVPLTATVPPPPLRPDGKVGAAAMDQVRLQQIKQQQLAQQQQQIAQQQQQLAQARQAQVEQQKKPEPIYDLPVHNKPKQISDLSHYYLRLQQRQHQQQQQEKQLQQQQQQQLQQQQQQQQQLQQQQIQQQQLQQQQLQQQQLQQQQLQQQQLQQQQLQQQQLQQQQQQRQSRPQQQRAVSLSSRDTSVFSTSSGCEGESWWRGGSSDPRDLDALLQYIEGPARRVDRGKKRAKKQRQKAKKMEQKLLEEREEFEMELSAMRRELEATRATHAALKRRVEETKKTLAHHNKTKKKAGGKKTKVNGTQQAKVQQLAEVLGELTHALTQAGKKVQDCEKQVSEWSRRLHLVDQKLAEARAMQGKDDEVEQNQYQRQQQAVDILEMEKHKLERQKQAAILKAVSAGAFRVTRSGPGPTPTSARELATMLASSHQHTITKIAEPQLQPPAIQMKAQVHQTETQKKHSWEQALAHINQIAKGNKEKKKQKETQQKEEKPKERSQSLPSATQPLSKKQRKLLAKQQAEEEERKRLEAEARAKKTEKKPEPKTESNKKQDKKTEAKKGEATKKEEKKESGSKKDKQQEKKGKENKQEKNAQQQQQKQKQQQQQPSTQQATSKKEKKKEQRQTINLPPDTTIEISSNKNLCNDPENPASCSIMEQLSCGVQVADLKLPPGITLTRVQPSEKKDPPPIKSVPAWKCGQLAATPTPVARPPPVINADPAMMMFTTHHHQEPPKTIIIPEPTPAPPPKSKKAKKKAKKAAAAAENLMTDSKQDGTKMVTLRNPMFHPNLPPVQISSTPAQKKEQIRIPDPIPMPPSACQATITPTSNGMYTIRNPLMSIMHQQSLMGLRNQSPQINPVYAQPQYNYVNPNVYNPVPNPPPQTYVIDASRNSPKTDEFQSRIMNLASFTQKNDDGYSLFKTSEDSTQKNFLSPEYFENSSPKPTVSPNPIGTRPNTESNRSFDSDSSLFTNPIQRPEPIGTPLKRDEINSERSDFSSLYTPFGQEDKNVFRNALFSDKNESSLGKADDMGQSTMANGDPLPYFQRLRVGSKLNNEVTIHHVTESKFYKGQECPPVESVCREPVFRAPPVWADSLYSPLNNPGQSSASSPTGESLCSGGGAVEDDPPYGAVGQRQRDNESSVFLPDRSITNLSSLEVSEREIESFKRFDFYFEPPQHKPRVALDVRDIANALRHNK